MVLKVCITQCKEYPDGCSGTIPEFVNIIAGYPCGKLGWNNKKGEIILLNPEVDNR